jgi:large subunit ribosomal protein L29
MTIDEVKQLSDAELQVELERLERHLFDLRSQAVTEKLENPTQLTKARRDIARIKTVQRQRELEQAAQAQ